MMGEGATLSCVSKKGLSDAVTWKLRSQEKCSAGKGNSWCPGPEVGMNFPVPETESHVAPVQRARGRVGREGTGGGQAIRGL